MKEYASLVLALGLLSAQAWALPEPPAAEGVPVCAGAEFTYSSIDSGHIRYLAYPDLDGATKAADAIVEKLVAAGYVVLDKTILPNRSRDSNDDQFYFVITYVAKAS